MKNPEIIQFNSIGKSELGYISIAEGTNIPFTSKRIYWTYHTPQNIVRGHHAHKQLEQVLIAVAGTIEVKVETISGDSFDFVLDEPNKGVYLPAMSWRTMKYSHNAVQVCLASMEFCEDDYIRNYEHFKQIQNGINV